MRFAVIAVIAALAGACTYNATFRDCEVRVCAGPDDCPPDFTCDGEGFCRAPGASQSCVAVLGDANMGIEANARCSGSAATCSAFTGNAACVAQEGCGWTATTCKVNVNCEAVPTASQCENTAGCAIDYTGAGGTWCKPYAPYCSGGAGSKSQCESKPQCTFGGGCLGVANACGEFTRDSTCNAQAGCSWH
jgi:hypothetical protein